MIMKIKAIRRIKILKIIYFQFIFYTLREKISFQYNKIIFKVDLCNQLLYSFIKQLKNSFNSLFLLEIFFFCYIIPFLKYQYNQLIIF